VTSADGVVAINEYRVRAERGPRGWQVRLSGPDGSVAMERACTDEAEARTFASTVQQHVYWLSPDRFRSYYRIV
jgi:hypothetical protein